MSDFSAHTNSAVKTVAVIPEGPQVITGGADNSMKVWNFSQGTPELNTTIPTAGSVQHIDVKDGNTVVLSCDENISGDPNNNVPVGIVKVMNPTDRSLMPIKVSLLVKYYQRLIDYITYILCYSDQRKCHTLIPKQLIVL